MKIVEIARLVNGELRGEGSVDISGIAALESAGPADLTFVDGARALEAGEALDGGLLSRSIE